MGKNSKERLDILLTSRNLVESRSKAQGLILAGKVFVEEQRVDKCGSQFPRDVAIRIVQEKEWVSRGAYKLLKAFEVFPVTAEEACCLDVGASTGGFTEVLLAQRARKVYAVDVGYGQFHWKLRQDPRITLFERTNARHLESSMFPDLPEFCCMDVSFISFACILPALEPLLTQRGEMIFLIKPQFEAGRARLGKGGVVTDPEVHREVLQESLEFVQNNSSFRIAGLDFSPVKGPKGNLEFLLYLSRQQEKALGLERFDSIISRVVQEAHEGK